MMKKRYKWILVGAIFFASLAAYGAAVFRPASVRTEEVRVGNLENHVTAQAFIKPEDTVILSSATSGVVTQVSARPGLEAGEGEILVEVGDGLAAETGLQREQLKRQLQSARQQYDGMFGEHGTAASNLESAKSRYELAKKNYENGRVLNRQGGFLSDAEVSELKTGYEVALQEYQLAERQASDETRAYYEEQIASVKKQLELFEATVGPGAVRMPFDGVVWEIYVENGTCLTQNQPVAKIYCPDRMKLSASVLSEDAAGLSVGQTAEVTFADGTESEAEIVFISKTASTEVSSIGLEENRCVVELLPDHLPVFSGAGQKAEVEFTILAAEQTVTAPASAIVSDGEGSIVYVVERGKALAVSVTTGKKTGGRAEIVSGLKEGARLIVDPYDSQIKVGMRVEEAVD